MTEDLEKERRGDIDAVILTANFLGGYLETD